MLPSTSIIELNRVPDTQRLPMLSSVNCNLTFWNKLQVIRYYINKPESDLRYLAPSTLHTPPPELIILYLLLKREFSMDVSSKYYLTWCTVFLSKRVFNQEKAKLNNLSSFLRYYFTKIKRYWHVGLRSKCNLTKLLFKLKYTRLNLLYRKSSWRIPLD
jgi:hypothetical protein